MKDIKELIGKTITGAKYQKVVNSDDEGFIELSFSDGSKTFIVAGYGGYTGGSLDEYPTYILVLPEVEEDLEDIK